jgi:hypothetical protein
MDRPERTTYHVAAIRLTHRPSANVAQTRFRERESEVETIDVAPDFLIDIDTTGAVDGISTRLLTAGRIARR